MASKHVNSPIPLSGPSHSTAICTRLRMSPSGIRLRRHGIHDTALAAEEPNTAAEFFVAFSIERMNALNIKRALLSIHRRSALACAAMSLSFTLVGSAQQPLQRMQRHVRPIVTTGQATLVGSLPPQQMMQLALMLPLRNQGELNKVLGQLYDPSSPDYRHFLNVEQFTEQFSPTKADYQAVIDFAHANGFSVTDTPANRLTVFVNGTAAQVEKAFNVRMNVYKHPTETRTFFSPDREPSLNLSIPLWHISGLDNYSIPRPLYKTGTNSSLQTNATGSGPGGSFLGSDRRVAYYGGYNLTGAGQTVALFELDGYALSDVQTYFSNVGQTLNVPIQNVLVNGASGGSGGDDREQVIDIIDAVSMAPGLSQVLVYIAPQSTFAVGTSDVALFNKIATDNIAKQISVSWGWNPADPSSDDPIFEEFASQGQNVFVASGDDGAWYANDYVFPADDSLITSVGGTLLTTNSAGGSWASEIAWGGSNSSCSGYGSGGGISPDNIPIPSYQQLSGVINSSNMGSSTYRNGPDVAAEGNCDNYYCANGSCANNLGGTSLAAPTWAGLMALANQQAASAGEASAGFINPVIYSTGIGSSYSTSFHDIAQGDNFNGPSPSLFSTVPGYDLVTGWGSPNGQSMINVLSGVTPADTPQVSNITVTTNGGSPSTGTNYVFTMNIADGTPNATIHYSISACGKPPVGGTTNPGQFVYTCSGFSSVASATMYATTPGYAMSPSTTVDF